MSKGGAELCRTLDDQTGPSRLDFCRFPETSRIAAFEERLRAHAAMEDGEVAEEEVDEVDFATPKVSEILAETFAVNQLDPRMEVVQKFVEKERRTQAKRRAEAAKAKARLAKGKSNGAKIEVLDDEDEEE